ncbi:APC family permease [Candidatus Mycoplasma pogonae]
MSQSSTKKIGFFVALTMLLGSVVGIGIFFKNASIAKATDGEGLVWLFSWIVGGVIAAAAALLFSELGFFKNTKLSGVGNWAHKVGGKTYGYFTSFVWAYFYFGILLVVLGIFVSESLITTIVIISGSTTAVPFYVNVIVGLVLSVLFLVLNYVSIKASGWLQSVTTVLKFAPILVAIIVGLAYAGTHNVVNLENPEKSGKDAFDVVGSGAAGFTKLIAALPAVLFAYDAFLNVAVLGKKVKKSSKNIPLIIIVGMLSVVVLYTLVAVSSILHNQGTIQSLMNDSLPKEAQKGIAIFVWLFITISAFGVINGFSAAAVAELSRQKELKLLFGMGRLTSKFSPLVVDAILFTAILAFWSLVISVPALALGGDRLVDGASNFPTLFTFFLHGITIGLYLFKRYKHPEVVKQKRYSQLRKGLNDILVYSFGFVAVIGLVGTPIAWLILLIKDSFTNLDSTISWGVFFDSDPALKNWQGLVVALVYILLFVALPALNYLLVKKFEKRDLVKDFDEIAGTDEEDEDIVHVVVKQEIAA